MQWGPHSRSLSDGQSYMSSAPYIRVLYKDVVELNQSIKHTGRGTSNSTLWVSIRRLS